jgi:hypothetical protein
MNDRIFNDMTIRADEQIFRSRIPPGGTIMMNQARYPARWWSTFQNQPMINFLRLSLGSEVPRKGIGHPAERFMVPLMPIPMIAYSELTNFSNIALNDLFPFDHIDITNKVHRYDLTVLPFEPDIPIAGISICSKVRECFAQ